MTRVHHYDLVSVQPSPYLPARYTFAACGNLEIHPWSMCCSWFSVKSNFFKCFKPENADTGMWVSGSLFRVTVSSEPVSASSISEILPPRIDNLVNFGNFAWIFLNAIDASCQWHSDRDFTLRDSFVSAEIPARHVILSTPSHFGPLVAFVEQMLGDSGWFSRPTTSIHVALSVHIL